jgi:hypothetical protein
MSACLLCSAPDSEEHSMLHCPGPQNTSLLEQIRNDTSFEITRYINTLRPGLHKSMATTYRDLALSPSYTASQPQRVWKGLLSPNQLNTLLQQHNITPTTPHDSMLLKCMKHIQRLLAIGYKNIRNQLTAHMYPSRYCTPAAEPPTTAQTLTITERLTQPTITTLFPSKHSNQRQHDSRAAFRSILRPSQRQRAQKTPTADTATTSSASRTLPPNTIRTQRQRTDIRIIHPTTKPTGLYFSAEWNPGITNPALRGTTIYTQQPTTATPQVATDSLASTTIIPLLRDNKHTQPTNEVKRQTTTAVRFLQTTQSPSGLQSPNPPQHENALNGVLDGD